VAPASINFTGGYFYKEGRGSRGTCSFRGATENTGVILLTLTLIPVLTLT